LNNLATVYEAQKKFVEAEPLFKRSLAIREKILGPDDPQVAQTVNNLATLYQHQDKYAEAEPLFKRALEIWEKNLGPDHPDVASSVNNLATLYQDQDKYAEAEPLFKRALKIWEKNLGPEHPNAATSLNNLAMLYLDQDKYAEAEPLFKRALEIREKKLGPKNLEVASSLENYAVLLRRTQRSAMAKELKIRATAIRIKRVKIAKYFGAAIGLFIALAAALLCAWVTYKVAKPASKPMIPAFSVQVAQAFWVVLAYVMIGQPNGTWMVLVILAAGLTWLMMCPGLGPVTLLTILQAVGLYLPSLSLSAVLLMFSGLWFIRAREPTRETIGDFGEIS
jgi:tetratricopeptide (TPR) repeat protein